MYYPSSSSEWMQTRCANTSSSLLTACWFHLTMRSTSTKPTLSTSWTWSRCKARPTSSRSGCWITWRLVSTTWAQPCNHQRHCMSSPTALLPTISLMFTLFVVLLTKTSRCFFFAWHWITCTPLMALGLLLILFCLSCSWKSMQIPSP